MIRLNSENIRSALPDHLIHLSNLFGIYRRNLTQIVYHLKLYQLKNCWQDYRNAHFLLKRLKIG